MHRLSDPPEELVFGLSGHLMFLTRFTDSNPPPDVAYLVANSKDQPLVKFLVLKIGTTGFVFQAMEAELLAEVCFEFAKQHPQEPFATYFTTLATDVRKYVPELHEHTVH
jgi:hypothetical protein